MKKFLYAMGMLLISISSLVAENIDFTVKTFNAGKASLTSNSYSVMQMLGIANFSPELKFPIQLIYSSENQATKMFGFAWNSPQLESSAVPQRGGVLWTTPWGEKILFSPKDVETPKDAIKLDLYEDAKKGNGYFAPYSNWEANTHTRKENIKEAKDWVFEGKKGYDGWTFVYRDSKLRQIKSPAKGILSFNYSRDVLTSISQDGEKFVELSYANDRVTGIKINGISKSLTYVDTKITVLPKTISGNIIVAARSTLSAIQTAKLNPIEFKYDNYGFLNQIKQDKFEDNLVVAHQTLSERKAQLSSKTMPKKINGRIIKDSFFDYNYKTVGRENIISLTNRANQKATYNYSQSTGIFKISEFSGTSYTIYYYMRYDVAYLGKVRKITNSENETIASYKYEKMSGNLLRVRNMFDNDINYSYDSRGNLILISRRAADQYDPEAVAKLSYDRDDNLIAVASLDEKGQIANKTMLRYNGKKQVTYTNNGQGFTYISYNKYGYVNQVRNNFNQINSAFYNKYNQLESTKDMNGVVTTYSYNEAGLIDKIERKDGKLLLNSLEITYNNNGQAISYIDQDKRVKSFERNEFGQVVKEFFPDNSKVEYSYNKLGQIDSVIDQNNHKLTFDWSKFGLENKRTAEGQVTDYSYLGTGKIARIASKQGKNIDRDIVYSYDKYNRVVEVDYGKGETEKFTYDAWGKILTATRGDKVATFKYDFFGRMIEKSENGITNNYSYNNYGQRLTRVTKNGALVLSETNTYDAFGRLVATNSNGKEVKYQYNLKNQLSAQLINGMLVEYKYTKYGQLDSKVLGGFKTPIATLKYNYSLSGVITSREIDNIKQEYKYDLKGQLLEVVGSEKYQYDLAGNILSKTIGDKTTTYTYDKANQLVSSTCDNITTNYEYDAAGRLVKEGNKTYQYGYLDKILSVQEDNKNIASFDYHVDGQIASATQNGTTENFLWDGLALIHRGETSFVNEPYITGGNPILSSKDGVMFNDMLGNTLATKNETLTKINMTAFGETDNKDAMFTGKPLIGELGYAFLFRNYRADQGKWQTSDPLGYPDGWNNFAYVNNGVTSAIDWLGGEVIIYSEVEENEDLELHWWIEIHRDGEKTGAAGFYPKDVGILTGVFGPGIVYMGTDENHINDKNKIIQNVYRTTQLQELSLIQTIFDQYYDNPPFYTGLLPSFVCYDFTQMIEDIIQKAFNLSPSNYTYLEELSWLKDIVSDSIRTKPE